MTRARVIGSLIILLAVLIGGLVWVKSGDKEGVDVPAPAAAGGGGTTGDSGAGGGTGAPSGGGAAGGATAADAVPASGAERQAGIAAMSGEDSQPANAERFAGGTESTLQVAAGGDLMSDGTAGSGANLDSVLLGSSAVPGAKGDGVVQGGGAAALGGFNVCLAVTPLDEASKAQAKAMAGPADVPDATKKDVTDLKEALSGKVAERAAFDASAAVVTGAAQRASDDASKTGTAPPNTFVAAGSAPAGGVCATGQYSDSSSPPQCQDCKGPLVGEMQEGCWGKSESQYWVLGLIKNTGAGCNLLPSNVLLATTQLVETAVKNQANHTAFHGAARVINDAAVGALSVNGGGWSTSTEPAGLQTGPGHNWTTEWSSLYDRVATLPDGLADTVCNQADYPYRQRAWVITPIQEGVALGGEGGAYPRLKNPAGADWVWVPGSVNLLVSDTAMLQAGSAWALERDELIKAGKTS